MNSSKFIELVQDTYGTKEFIPLHVPRFNGNEINYLNETIKSTFVSSVGKFVDKVEDFGADYTNTKKAVAVVNGTAAIQVSLRLAGVNEGDEVLTQSLTFVATANAIAYNGALPVFIDVDLDTMGLSPSALENFLDEFGEVREDGLCYNKTSGRKIAACLPMHTFGFMNRIQEIVSVCKKWSIPVVEDAAEAFGSESENQSAGSFGLMGAFSFNGNKIITAGGGGLIVSQGEDLASRAKHLTTTAKKPHRWEYYHDEIGYNFRMPNVNAALLLAQMEDIEKYRGSKQQVYDIYKEALANSGLLVEIPETTSKWNYWLMSLKFNTFEERNLFLEKTNQNGVMTRPCWQLMFKLPMFSNAQRDDQKNAMYLEERVVNIPSSARQ